MPTVAAESFDGYSNWHDLLVQNAEGYLGGHWHRK